MPFNTALSGLRAASSALKITGNNIANASTTGFKSSRAEFGDVYAASLLGGGDNQIGSGVRLQAVSQQFSKGNVTFTENGLDLAIPEAGGGFFIVNNDGERLYTRAGAFGRDENGFIVNKVNARLQGFRADENGNIGGVLEDLQLETNNQLPRQTTLVEQQLNLDARETVLQTNASTFTADGSDIGSALAGRQTEVRTTFTGAAVPFSSIAAPVTVNFDIALASPSLGTTTHTLNLGSVNLSNTNDVNTLINNINTSFNSQTPAVPITASAVSGGTAGNPTFQIVFEATGDVEASTLAITSNSNSANIGLAAGTATAGVPEGDNGYPESLFTVSDENGATSTIRTTAGATAAQIASQLNGQPGISATATTTATLPATGFNNASGNMRISVNGVQLSSTTLQAMEAEINILTTTTNSLPGISASFDVATGDLTITSSTGNDLEFTLAENPVPTDGDSFQVNGASGTTNTLEFDTDNVTTGTASTGQKITVGGAVDLVVNEGYSIDSISPVNRLFTTTGLQNPGSIVLNQFDPRDEATFNHSTSLEVFDSLGNPHVMTQYFIKQPYDPLDPETASNHWQMVVQIDGRDVGDPLPGSTDATQATFDVFFNPNGTMDTALTDTILISNWTPLDADGDPNGAEGPLNVLAGGTTPVAEPPTSSNFQLLLTGSTQARGTFGVNGVDQNGYSTGRLSGIDISKEGLVFARYSNNQTQVIAQLALANFPNVQGLQPVGDTMWAENADSGIPVVNTPGAGSLGLVQSGALEESNVNLSDELVALIIAQRNFQASAKTIETADQTTQTIINLR